MKGDNCEYHYHHGLKAHQHPGGVCPYEEGDTKDKPGPSVKEEDDREREVDSEKDGAESSDGSLGKAAARVSGESKM